MGHPVGARSQGLRNRKQGPGRAGSHEQRLSTEGDESDDDDSSPAETVKGTAQNLNNMSLDSKSDDNGAGASAAANGKEASDGEAAFDVSKIKGKLGKRGVGGRPVKAPDSKAKEKAAKDKKDGKKKVRSDLESIGVRVGARVSSAS